MDALGIGIYHTGVEVYGVEYAFGGREGCNADLVGIASMPPRSARAKFREAIFLGHTQLSAVETRLLIKAIGPEWKAASYHLLQRNCNHFSQVMLGGRWALGTISDEESLNSFTRRQIPFRHFWYPVWSVEAPPRDALEGGQGWRVISRAVVVGQVLAVTQQFEGHWQQSKAVGTG